MFSDLEQPTCLPSRASSNVVKPSGLLGVRSHYGCGAAGDFHPSSCYYQGFIKGFNKSTLSDHIAFYGVNMKEDIDLN